MPSNQLAAKYSFVVFISVVSFCAGTLLERKRRKENNQTSTIVPESLPDFAIKLESDPTLHQVRLREWEDLEWRIKNGWSGRDLCHNPEGSAVRVLSYYHNESSNEMIGVVWFGPDAESHRGLCHGGAMTSLMDDFCGHMAFLNSKSPWSGATVQVNCSLKKPIPIGSVLRIAGRVTKQSGRKVSVEAVLDNGRLNAEEERLVYATFEGLSIDGVKMSNHSDSISERTWEVDVCNGRLQRRDSSFSVNI